MISTGSRGNRWDAQARPYIVSPGMPGRKSPACARCSGCVSDRSTGTACEQMYDGDQDDCAYRGCGKAEEEATAENA